MELDKIYDVVKATKIEDIEKLIANCENYITIETLLFVIYDVHKYIPTKQITEEKKKRQYQTKFRNDLIKKYKHCIISNDDEELCEASHIVPFAESDNTQMYDVNNGLLLSSTLHKMFDDYLLTIDKDGNIILSNIVLNKKSYKNYHKYNGMKVKLNTDTLKNLQIHYDKFTKQNNI